MRINDWSSDVCSSYLGVGAVAEGGSTDPGSQRVTASGVAQVRGVAAVADGGGLDTGGRGLHAKGAGVFTAGLRARAGRDRPGAGRAGARAERGGVLTRSERVDRKSTRLNSSH